MDFATARILVVIGVWKLPCKFVIDINWHYIWNSLRSVYGRRPSKLNIPDACTTTSAVASQKIPPPTAVKILLFGGWVLHVSELTTTYVLSCNNNLWGLLYICFPFYEKKGNVIFQFFYFCWDFILLILDHNKNSRIEGLLGP